MAVIENKLGQCVTQPPCYKPLTLIEHEFKQQGHKKILSLDAISVNLVAHELFNITRALGIKV